MKKRGCKTQFAFLLPDMLCARSPIIVLDHVVCTYVLFCKVSMLLYGLFKNNK